MEHIYRVSSELSAESQWNSDQRRVGQGGTNEKIWPPIAEAFQRFRPGNIDRITIDGIDLGERINEIRRVALIATKSSPNRVGVNCDSQVACGSLAQETR